MFLRALWDYCPELLWVGGLVLAGLIAVYAGVTAIDADAQAGRICFSEPFETYRECRDWARDALDDGWTVEELTELVEGENAPAEWGV